MNNKRTVVELKKVVEKLIKRRSELEIAERRISSGSRDGRGKKRKLQKLIGEFLAEQNATEAIIREREAAEMNIPPLTENQVANFKDAMTVLSKVIKADQSFDALVAAAKGVIAASDQIQEATDA